MSWPSSWRPSGAECLALQKRDAVPGEKPNPVRTHLRDVVIVPEMIGSVIGVYNGKTFNQVEIKVRHSASAQSRCPIDPFCSPRWWAPTPASTPSRTSP